MRRGPYAAGLFLVSAALLSLEIALMRVLRVKKFGNFTFGAIAVALLGFGASGTLITLFRSRIRDEAAFSVLAGGLFILLLGAGFLVSAQVRFDPLRVVWDPAQLLRLAFRCLVYALPFVAGASVVVLGFSLLSTGKAYFFNLAGSSAGILLVLLFLSLLPPERILLVPLLLAAGGVGCMQAAVFSRRGPGRRAAFPSPRLLPAPARAGIPWAMAAAGLLLFLTGDIRVLPYKGSELALNLPDARVIHRSYSPHGTVEVIASSALRIAPGLSYAFQGELPRQHGLYLDGDLTGSIDRVTGPRSTDYLLHQAPAAVFSLHRRPAVLVAGLGGGTEAVRALAAGADGVTVSEPNPHLPPLLQRTFREFTGGLLTGERVAVTTADLRSLLVASDRRWDIVDISGVAAASRTIGRVYAAQTSYLLTVDAFRKYLNALAPGGTLTVTMPLQYPPRNLLKLAATARRALELEGLDWTGRVAVLRSWSDGTLLVRKRPFGDADLEALRDFSERMLFDLVYLPGISPEEVNRYTQVEGALYARYVERVLRGDRAFSRDYPFTVRAPTDDRPYFSYFFRPLRMPSLFREMGREWLFVVEGGYLVAAAIFAAVAVLSCLLILLPVAATGKRMAPGKGGVLAYFGALGLSYLFIEVLLMEMYSRYISNPLYSNSTVIATMMLFSGVGSFLSDRLADRPAGRQAGSGKGPGRGREPGRGGPAPGRVLLPPVAALTAWFAVLLACYDPLARAVIRRGLPLVPLMVALTAPPAVLMGLFFPLGLAEMKRRDPYSLPWAWSVNGFFSVLASTGAVLVTANTGILAAGLLPVAGYWIALLSFPGRRVTRRL
jgi:hypothetical protein